MGNRMHECDSSGMFSLITGFPGQCRKAVEIASIEEPDGYGAGIENVVVAGMGGSAIGGDILCNCVSGELEAPLEVVRDYSLPAYAGEKTLFIAASYSGDTEETLSACSQALSRGARVICVTSGGMLEKLGLERGAHVVRIPPGQPPRTALGYLFFPMLVKLSQSGLVARKDAEIDRTIALMDDMSRRLSEEGGPAEETARALEGAIPVIYGSSGVSACAALRWRTQINENSKSLAFTALLPEMNHNEIVGWENPPGMLKNMPVVLLRDRGDHERVNTRMEITKSLLGGMPPSVTEIWSEGESLMERVFSLMYYGDFVSFYLAALYGVDPTPVKKIQTLKERLKEK